LLSTKANIDDHLFGITIKQGRKKLALTQEKLAELVGVELRTLQRWEAGIYAPRPEYIDKLVSIMPKIEKQLRRAIKKICNIAIVTYSEWYMGRTKTPCLYRWLHGRMNKTYLTVEAVQKCIPTTYYLL
jgi:DNA-binding transcriptional regulator YiaG